MDWSYNTPGRRGFLKMAGLAAAGIAMPNLSSAEGTITLADVRAGRASAQDYVTGFSERFLPVQQAKKDGVLLDLLYQPSDEDLETRLRLMFFGITDNDSYNTLVRYGMETYADVKSSEHNLACEIPSSTGLFGSGLATYAIIMNSVFDDADIKGEKDVEAIVIHELRHTRDMALGIALGDVRLVFESLAPRGTETRDDQISLMFYKSLSEYRAYAEGAAYILADYMRSGNEPNLANLSVALNGATENIAAMKGLAKSELERKILPIQLSNPDFPQITDYPGKVEVIVNVDGTWQKLNLEKGAH